GDAALGGEVVYVGTGTSFVDEDLVPGAAAYAAFAIDAAGGPSRGTVVAVELPLPAQTLLVTIQTGTAPDMLGSVEVSDAPAHIGVAARINTKQSTPTQPVFELQLTNRTSRVLYVPKLVLRRAEAEEVAIPPADITKRKGQAAQPADGTLPIGAPFYYIDPLPNGWAPGTTRSTQLVIANQVADTTIELELEVLPHRMIITYTGFDDDRAAGGPLFDAVGPKQVGNLAISVTGPGQDFGYRPGVFSLDGRYLYLGSRNSPEITTYDLVTMGETQTARIAGEHDKTHVQQLMAGPDGRTLYALFNDGAHAYHSVSPGEEAKFQVPIHVELVAIDRVTWKELARVRLATRSGPSDYHLRGRRFALSPDGSLAVITVSGGRPGDADDDVSGEDRGSVHIVELATLTEVDTDAGTEGTQPIALDDVPVTGGGDPVVFNPSWPTFVDADTVLIGPSYDDTEVPNDAIVVPQNMIAELDMSDYSVRAVKISDTDNVRRATRLGDRIFLHGSDKLWRYDVEEHAAEDVGWTGEALGFIMPSGADHILAIGNSGGSTLYRISLTNGAEEWAVPSAPSGSMYGLGITPY
ncbi:MAG TPA: hypothetical protein VMZ28_17970, partial [Kofleriaceae bacterium]|nr:hypothetical protein [Kofleriaceae bacterium]